MDALQLRIATLADLPFLRQMLFEAAYWRPEQPRPNLDQGLADPDLAKILSGWQREGDIAVIAEHAGQPIGAAWLRYWNDTNHSYGYVDDKTPELGIGVVAKYRRQGIGRAIMKRLIQAATDRGIRRISLSVEIDNPSRFLYQSEGFETVGYEGNSQTMLLMIPSS